MKYNNDATARGSQDDRSGMEGFYQSHTLNDINTTATYLKMKIIVNMDTWNPHERFPRLSSKVPSERLECECGTTNVSLLWSLLKQQTDIRNSDSNPGHAWQQVGHTYLYVYTVYIKFGVELFYILNTMRLFFVRNEHYMIDFT